MKYENECYNCGHTWDSELDDEPCPNCGEIDDIVASCIDA